MAEPRIKHSTNHNAGRKVESPARTLLVAFLVCAVCSVMVSTTAVLLEPRQRANRERERKAQIHAIVARQPGLDQLLEDRAGVSLEAHVIELATGEFADHLDAATFDARRAAQDPLLGVALPRDKDPAGIGRRAKFAVVYLIEAAGRIELILLPVHGNGYASTMYGYLALAGDTNTVAGISFYEHKETPGIGGDIDENYWLEVWPGKLLRDETGELRIAVAPDEVDPDSPGAEYLADGLTGATRTCNGVTQLLHYWLGEEGFAPFLERVRQKNEERP